MIVFTVVSFPSTRPFRHMLFIIFVITRLDIITIWIATSILNIFILKHRQHPVCSETSLRPWQHNHTVMSTLFLHKSCLYWSLEWQRHSKNLCMDKSISLFLCCLLFFIFILRRMRNQWILFTQTVVCIITSTMKWEGEKSLDFQRFVQHFISHSDLDTPGDE